MALDVVLTEQGLRALFDEYSFPGRHHRQAGPRCGGGRTAAPAQTRLKLDLVIANGENAAGGFGLTRAIAEEFFAMRH